jgi:hypothetical protein
MLMMDVLMSWHAAWGCRKCVLACKLGETWNAGALAVKRVGGVPTVFPAEGGHVTPQENLLQVVYDHGPVQVCACPSCGLSATSHAPFVKPPMISSGWALLLDCAPAAGDYMLQTPVT